MFQKAKSVAAWGSCTCAASHYSILFSLPHSSTNTTINSQFLIPIAHQATINNTTTFIITHSSSIFALPQVTNQNQYWKMIKYFKLCSTRTISCSSTLHFSSWTMITLSQNIGRKKENFNIFRYSHHLSSKK